MISRILLLIGIKTLPEALPYRNTPSETMTSLVDISELKKLFESFGLQAEDFIKVLTKFDNAGIGGMPLARLGACLSPPLAGPGSPKEELNLYVASTDGAKWADYLINRYGFNEAPPHTYAFHLSLVPGKQINIYTDGWDPVKKEVTRECIDLLQLTYDGSRVCSPLWDLALKREMRLLPEKITPVNFQEVLKAAISYQAEGFTFPEYSSHLRVLMDRFTLAENRALLSAFVRKELRRDGLLEVPVVKGPREPDIRPCTNLSNKPRRLVGWSDFDAHTGPDGPPQTPIVKPVGPSDSLPSTGKRMEIVLPGSPSTGKRMEIVLPGVEAPPQKPRANSQLSRFAEREIWWVGKELTSDLACYLAKYLKLKDVGVFMKLLETTGALLAGGVGLQLLRKEHLPEDDLEIYVNMGAESERWLNYLQQTEGFKVTFESDAFYAHPSLQGGYLAVNTGAPKRLFLVVVTPQVEPKEVVKDLMTDLSQIVYGKDGWLNLERLREPALQGIVTITRMGMSDTSKEKELGFLNASLAWIRKTHTQGYIIRNLFDALEGYTERARALGDAELEKKVRKEMDLFTLGKHFQLQDSTGRARAETESTLHGSLIQFLKQFQFEKKTTDQDTTKTSPKAGAVGFITKLLELASWISGSASIQVALQEDYPYSDLDLYSWISREADWDTFLIEAGYLKTPMESNHYEFAHIQRVVRYSKPGISKTVNLVLVQDGVPIPSVINDFDLDICRLSYGGLRWLHLDMLGQISRREITIQPRSLNPSQITATLWRIVKYLKRGFTFKNLPEVLNIYRRVLNDSKKKNHIVPAPWLLDDLKTPRRFPFDPRTVIRVNSRWEPNPQELQFKAGELPLRMKSGVPSETTPKKETKEETPKKETKEETIPKTLVKSVPPTVQECCFDLSVLKREEFLSETDALRLLYAVQNWTRPRLRQVTDLSQLTLAYHQNWDQDLTAWKKEVWVIQLAPRTKMYISVRGGTPILITSAQPTMTPQDVLDAVKGASGRFLVNHLTQYIYKGLPLLAFD